MLLTSDVVRNSSFILYIGLFFLLGCNQKQNVPHVYEKQIGDTPFATNLDDSSFRFCNENKVLHKRAFVRYKGGKRALADEIIKKYNSRADKTLFSGYFIVRFAVNCKGYSGRFRMQIMDSDFNLTNCSNELKTQILGIVKGLKKWETPRYEGRDYDGYTFLTIKIKKGKIQVI